MFQKDTTRIAKLSSPPSYVQAKPSGDRILATRGNSGLQTSQPLIPRNHLQDSLVSFSVLPTAPLVHAPTTPNWVHPVAGPLYGVSKYFFTSRNPPDTYTEDLPPCPPPLPSSCRRHLYPHVAPGQRVCVLVSQSGRPNEMHNGIVATRRVSRSKRRFPWPGGSGAPCKPP